MHIKIPFTNYNLFLTPDESRKTGKRPFGFQRSGLSFAGGFQGLKLSYETFFTILRNNADVYGCIREWKQNVGSAGWELFDIYDHEAVVDPRIVEQVDRVLNFGQSWRFTLGRIVRDLGIADNSYAVSIKNLGGTETYGMQTVDPRTMTPICNENGDPLKYIQRNPITNLVHEEFSPDEVIHFRLDSDPNNESLGFSPLEPAAWEAQMDIAAMMTNYKFFENDATPAMIYVLEDGMSQEQQEEAIKSIRKEFGGVENKGKGGVLAGVKEIKQVSFNQKDMEYLNGRRFSTEKVCAAYGVPKAMLGYSQDVTFNNVEQMTENFYNGTILPIEQRIADILSRFLIQKQLGFENIGFRFKTQAFNLDNRKLLALDEFRTGAITLRQYKKRVGDQITPDDEKTPNFDAYVLQSGASSVLLEEVGIDPMAVADNEMALNAIKAFDEKVKNLKNANTSVPERKV